MCIYSVTPHPVVNIYYPCNNHLMTDTTKKRRPRGAPKKPDDMKRSCRLQVVQITKRQQEDYAATAKMENKTESDWIRDALDARVAFIRQAQAGSNEQPSAPTDSPPPSDLEQ